MLGADGEVLNPYLRSLGEPPRPFHRHLIPALLAAHCVTVCHAALVTYAVIRH